MTSWPTPRYLLVFGDMVRCIRCRELYMVTSAERDGFDRARGYMPCPKCEQEIRHPKRRRVSKKHVNLAGCALFAACLASWILAVAL